MRARSIPASATEEEIISDITDDISMADITEESTWGAADITEEEKALPECEPHQQPSKSQSQEFKPPSITDSSCITDSASITDSLDITDNRQITDTSFITDTT